MPKHADGRECEHDQDAAALRRGRRIGGRARPVRRGRAAPSTAGGSQSAASCAGRPRPPAEARRCHAESRRFRRRRPDRSGGVTRRCASGTSLPPHRCVRSGGCRASHRPVRRVRRAAHRRVASPLRTARSRRRDPPPPRCAAGPGRAGPGCHPVPWPPSRWTRVRPARPVRLAAGCAVPQCTQKRVPGALSFPQFGHCMTVDPPDRRRAIAAPRMVRRHRSRQSCLKAAMIGNPRASGISGSTRGLLHAARFVSASFANS